MKNLLLWGACLFALGNLKTNAAIENSEIPSKEEFFGYSVPGIQEPKFNVELYNQMLGEKTVLILNLPIDDTEKIKSIKQTAQVLQNLHSNMSKLPNLKISEYLFSENSSGSGFVDDILQLPISDDDKVKCIKFIQEKVNIYDFNSEPDLRLNYLEHLLLSFYHRNWEICPDEFHSSPEDLKSDIKLLVQNGFYKLDHIDSSGFLRHNEKTFNAKKLLEDILNDKI